MYRVRSVPCICLGDRREVAATRGIDVKTGGSATRGHAPASETPLQQVASFIEFFVWLLVLKTFFLPLFIIPTGSMAETLYGAHGTHTCPNCGIDYPVGFNRAPGRKPSDPSHVQCPNCLWTQPYASIKGQLKPTAGDRIIVHGWPYEFGGYFAPRNWDVVVFRNPAAPSENYIKRLIGLPHQKIEIINGDIFVDDKIARKPKSVQRSLWFSYYDHDYAPAEPERKSGYIPHWSDLNGETAWRDVETRTPMFDGVGKQRGEIRFLTRADPAGPYCEIVDEYGYNSPERGSGDRTYAVSDIRLSCDVLIEAGEGYVEFAATKHRDRYVARLYADGRVTLERLEAGGGRVALADGSAPLDGGPSQFALSLVDHSATVEIDGIPIASWQDDDITRGRAIELGIAEQRDLKAVAAAQKITLAAEGIALHVAHLKLERDVYYTLRTPRGRPQLHAVQGNPIQLGKDEYFVLGDNSPSSLDSRFWQTQGPHLEGAGFQLGTVPASQMIGRAFFVYWPGFLPLWKGEPIFQVGPRSSGWNLLPNFGKIRWIY